MQGSVTGAIESAIMTLERRFVLLGGHRGMMCKIWSTGEKCIHEYKSIFIKYINVFHTASERYGTAFAYLGR